MLNASGCSSCGPYVSPQHQNGQHPPASTPSGRPRGSSPRHRRRLAAPRRSASFSQIDSRSVSIVGFQDIPTEYVVDLDSVDFDGTTVTVEVTVTRNGDSAVVDDADATLFVAGQPAQTVELNPSSFGNTVTISAPASAGDPVHVEWSTDQFGGASAAVTGGTLESVNGNGGNGGGNGGGGNGGNGGDGTGRALLAVGGIAALMLAASR